MALSSCASVVQSEAGLDVGRFDFGPILYIEDEVEYLLFDEGEKIVVGQRLVRCRCEMGRAGCRVFRKLLPGESQRNCLSAQRY